MIGQTIHVSHSPSWPTSNESGSFEPVAEVGQDKASFLSAKIPSVPFSAPHSVKYTLFFKDVTASMLRSRHWSCFHMNTCLAVLTPKPQA